MDHLQSNVVEEISVKDAIETLGGIISMRILN